MPRHPALMALSSDAREEFTLSRAEKPALLESEASPDAPDNPDEPWWADLEALDKIEEFQDRSHRLGKGKPARRRTVAQLHAASDINFKNDDRKFIDSGLEELFIRGLVKEVLWQLKSGKEATVYVCEGQAGLVAAKLYVDSRVRGFKDDALYREGRHIDDKRLKKAIDQRSETGISAQNFLWVQEEFMQLHALHNAGVRVPKPLAHEASVILMEFIGNEEEVAPRVADARLTREQAEIAFADALDQYGRILATGRVHGDFSTFNLLWWEGRCVVIDFPQVVTIKQPTAKAILERDVQGLCRTFSTFGIKKRLAGGVKSHPDSSQSAANHNANRGNGEYPVSRFAATQYLQLALQAEEKRKQHLPPESQTRCLCCQADVVGSVAGCLESFQAAMLNPIVQSNLNGSCLFDAYCLQHPEIYCVSAKSYAVHLAFMVCWMEFKEPQQQRPVLQRGMNGVFALEKAPLLEFRGEFSHLHWQQADTATILIRADEWLQSVWAAYAPLHSQARAYAQLFLQKGR